MIISWAPSTLQIFVEIGPMWSAYRAYDSNPRAYTIRILFDIWRATSAVYLLTYLL